MCAAKRCSAPRSAGFSAKASSAARASFSSFAISRETSCREAWLSSCTVTWVAGVLTVAGRAVSSREAAHAAGPVRSLGRDVLGPQDRVLARDAAGAARQAEAGHRLAQLRGQLGELADRGGRRRGALGGLRADLAQHLHVAGDVLRRRGLLAGARRDVLHEARDL